VSNEHSSIMVKLVLRLTSLEHKIMQGSTHKVAAWCKGEREGEHALVGHLYA